MTEHNAAYYDRHFADRPIRPEPRRAPELVEVWCDKCPEPATARIPLTNGKVAVRCDQHAWLLRAPRGRRKETT